MENIKVLKPYEEIEKSLKECKLIIEDVNTKKSIKEILINSDEIRLEFDKEKIFYYRYKYQKKNHELNLWEDISEFKFIDERVTNYGVKYLYNHYENSKALIVIFQGLSEKPSYNYIRTLKDIKVSQLFIKDDLGESDTKATYYLGKNKKFDISIEVSRLVEEFRSLNNLDKDSVILVGSSKGGYAALYQCFMNEYKYAIVGAPQIYLGDYLGKNIGNKNSKLVPIYNYLTNDNTGEYIGWLNSILFNKIKKCNIKPTIFYHVGIGEPHYSEHYINFKKENELWDFCNIISDLEDYNKHNELTKYYPKYLCNSINRILEYKDLKKDLVFKRRKFNKETFEFADKLIKNEIYMFKIWEPIKIENKIDWNMNPFGDKTWQFYFHSLDFICHLVNAYENSGEEIYLKKSEEFIESWMNTNQNIEDATSEWAWKGHAVANRTMNIVYFLSKYEYLINKNRKFIYRIYELLDKQAKFLMDDNNYEDFNHGLFQDQALIEIAVLFPFFEESEKWKEKALKRILMRINKDFSEEGVHKEHSPDYHVIVMRLFIEIKAFLDYYNIEYSDELYNKFEKMQEYLALIIKDNGTMPLIGDTSLSYARNCIEKQFIVNEQLLYEFSNGVYGKPFNSSFFQYDKSGVSIYKEKGKLFWMFTAAFNSKVHKHADDLSFVLDYLGKEYIVDCGKYNYKESDKYRKFFRSSFAHNNIICDGKSYLITDKQAEKVKIINSYNGEWYCYVTGIHNLYKGVFIKRRLIQIKGAALIIHDIIKSNDTHKYEQNFNFSSNVEISSKSKRNINIINEDKFINLKQLIQIDEMKNYKGDTNPIRGWKSDKFNEKYPINTISFESTGENVEFLTLINFSEETQIYKVKRKLGEHTDKYIIYYNENDYKEILINNQGRIR